MGVSKIVYGGRTLIDLTGDNVTAETLLAGSRAHGSNGDLINGECTFDADTSEANAQEAELLTGKTAYARGVELKGKMPNRSGEGGTISTKDEEYSIGQGYHDGSGKVSIASAEKQKLKPDNIRQGITILGVVGSMSGSEDVNAHAGEFTPTVEGGTVVPGDGFNYLTEVVVKPIPYVENDNSAGGKTVTIG